MRAFAEMGKDFEKVGIGVYDMSKTVQNMGLNSMKLGLNAKTTTAELDKSLGKLNQYGFKNGIEGLNRMIQESIEFRMNMQNVYDLAEKVWSPEGALEVVANLQMIGGAYGDLNDPIKLMYMATNDVEGLQDAIEGAAKSLVTYNQEQGRFQVTGANLRRAKEMAKELGMSMEELTTTAVASMERTQAASDLMGKGLVISDENKEFLTNIAQMRGGKMTIEVPKSIQEELGLKGTNIALETLTQEQANVLIARQEELQDKTMEEVAREQVTLVENIQRDVSFLRAVARVGVGREVGNLIEQYLGVNQKTLSEESKKGTDWLKSKMDNIGEFAKGTIESAFGVNNLPVRGTVNAESKTPIVEENKQKTEEKTTASSETITRNVHEHRFVSDSATVDELYRLMWRSPKWQENFEKSYLNPNSN
jgi:hypothetical protein